VVTLDTVDFNEPNVKHVLYFEYNWRLLRTDSYLKQIPHEKRALVLLEPANINPSLYMVPWLRDRFHTVFTWDLTLLKKNPSYTQINVPVGAEPQTYRENPFRHIAFADKTLSCGGEPKPLELHAAVDLPDPEARLPLFRARLSPAV
jgi:hypothetical protein